MRVVEFLQKGSRKYTDPFYDQSEIEAAKITGVPLEYLRGIRLAGEKSNEDQVSGAQARGVYQFIPETRSRIKSKYGVDAWDPNQASLAAAYLLKDSAMRNNGDYDIAVREYHGGTDRRNWGKYNQKYANALSSYVNGSNPQGDINNMIEDGTLDFDQLSQMMKSDPKMMPALLNHGNMEWYNENQRLMENLASQEKVESEMNTINDLMAQKIIEKKAQREQIMSMLPKAQATTSVFSRGGTLDDLDPDIVGFYNELNTLFPGTVITSSLRPGAKTSSGKMSRHALGQAIDLKPTPHVHKFLYSSQGDALLRKYNVGFLDETLEHNLKKTKGTGAHFHIGKDSTLKGNSYQHNTAMERQSFDTSGTEQFSLDDYSNTPNGPMPNMLNHGNQDWLEQNLMAENERLKQEEYQKEQEKFNLALQQDFQNKKAEREQIMSMLPKAKPTKTDNIF